MTIELRWMPANAPYMPVATVGLLSVLEANGTPARAHWEDIGERQQSLVIESNLAIGDVARAIAEAERPVPSRVPWPQDGYRQSLKKTLEHTGDPTRAFRDLLGTAAPQEARLLRAIRTSAVIDGGGIPGRSRLLRGVKADLSSADAKPKQIDPEHLELELLGGPRFIGTKSGLGLGLVPEIQTFGGTTGREASAVGAYSPLLYLLLWQGVLTLPPVGVRRGFRRVVGGPLVSDPESISWPRWRFPAGLAALRSCFAWAQIHSEEPRMDQLAPRGVDAVYRSKMVQLNPKIRVFRWGEQIAAR